MIVGIDFSTNIIAVSYYDRDRIKTYYIDDMLGYRDKELFNDVNKLAGLFAAVKGKADSVLPESVNEAVIAIPGYCGLTQKKKVYRAAGKSGIKVKRIMFPNECIAVSLYNELVFGERETIFICNIVNDYAEVSAYNFEHEFIESCGSIDVLVGKISTGEEAKGLRKKVRTDVRQFLRDMEPVTPFHVDKVFLSGLDSLGIVKECFERELLGFFRIKPIVVAGHISKGALITALKISGSNYSGDSVLLRSQDKSISAALGENGEFAKVIDYYTSYPTRSKCELLVSTENTLYIYEGNYQNRMYDEVIGRFTVPEELEGHIITVEVDIENDLDYKVTVRDDKGKVIINKARL